MDPSDRPAPRYPSLYQINTRVWLTELSRHLGRPATLDDVPDAELDRLSAARVRLGVVAERVAHGCGGATRVAHERRLAAGIRADPAGPARRRHRRLRLRNYRLHGVGSPRRRCRPGQAAREARGPRHAADARLRAQSHRPRSPVGGRPPGVLRLRHRRRPGPGPCELHADQACRGRPGARARPRSVLPGLARHAAARLRQPGDAGRDDGRTGAHRRPVRRCPLRHGHARPARCVRAYVGPAVPGFLAGGDRSRAGARPRDSASWPRSTGTSSGPFNSRGSTTRTTSGCTTGFERATRAPCASTSTPGSTSRTGSRGSSRTTTSPGPPRRSAATRTGPPPSSPSWLPGSASSTRGSSRGVWRASLRTSAGVRKSPPIRRRRRSTIGCSPC